MSKSSTSRAVMQVEPRVLHIGVDLGLEKNAVVVIDERAQGVDRFSFSQDRSGYDYFLQRVEMLRQKQQASSFAVAMEPTNYFWKLLARELEGKEIPYHLVNAYTVKKHREGDQLDRSKDDRRDAGQIAELSRTGHYTKTRLQQGAYEDLRQYAALYDQTNRSIRRERQLLWVLVGQVFPELFQAFCSLEGETCQALLRTCASAAAIRQVTVDALVSQVRSAYPGKKLGVKKLRQIHELSATSIGVTEGISAILSGDSGALKLSTSPTSASRLSDPGDVQLFRPPAGGSLFAIHSGRSFYSHAPGRSRRSGTLSNCCTVGQAGGNPTRSQYLRQETTQPHPHVTPRSLTLTHFALLRLPAPNPA